MPTLEWDFVGTVNNLEWGMKQSMFDHPVTTTVMSFGFMGCHYRLGLWDLIL